MAKLNRDFCKRCGEVAEAEQEFCDFCLEGEDLYAESSIPLETQLGDS